MSRIWAISLSPDHPQSPPLSALKSWNKCYPYRKYYFYTESDLLFFPRCTIKKFISSKGEQNEKKSVGHDHCAVHCHVCFLWRI
jgi:hypothetical protein